MVLRKMAVEMLQALVSDYQEEFDPGVEIDLSAQPPKLDFIMDYSDRRSNFRAKLQAEVIIVSREGKTLRAKTKNISSSGILLDQKLGPEFLDDEFDLTLSIVVNKKREYFLIRGKALDAPFSTPRVIYTALPEHSQKRLHKICKALYIIQHSTNPRMKKIG